MKFPIVAILLTLFLPIVAPAQTETKPSDSSEIIVLQKSWRREIHQPSMETDPFEANDQHRDQVIAQNEADRQNTRRSETVAVRPREQPVNIAKPLPSESAVYYVYRLKLKNAGARTIRSLAWEYIFYDQSSGKEMGRHQYTSKVKINSGKTLEVVEWSYSPPSQIVDAKKAGKDSREQLAEKIVINRVEFADGSVWENHSK